MIGIKEFLPMEPMYCMFAKMGKHEWLRYIPKEGLGYHYETRHALLKGIEGASLTANMMAALDPKGTLLLYLASKSLALGPKVFAPTFENCIAFEYSDIKIPWSDFRLSYDPIIIEFPTEYAERWRPHYGDNLPMGALIGMIGHRSLSIYVRHRNGEDSWFCLHDRPDCETIEDNLRSVYTEQILQIQEKPDAFTEDDYVDSADATLRRVVMNAALILGHIGSKVAGWADPAEQQRLARKTNKAAKAQVLGMAQVVKPIKVFVGIEFRPAKPEGNGTHASPRPHWRRGHWMMQAYGEGHSLRRKQWRSPVLVNLTEGTDPKDFPRRYDTSEWPTTRSTTGRGPEREEMENYPDPCQQRQGR